MVWRHQGLFFTALCLQHSRQSKKCMYQAETVTFPGSIIQLEEPTCLLEEASAVWVVFMRVYSAFELCLTLGSWDSGDFSFPTPDIIFTSVTQRRLPLAFLTFWCGTNSQRPTGSPSSAQAFCIYLFYSPILHPSFLSCYYFDWFSQLPCSSAQLSKKGCSALCRHMGIYTAHSCQDKSITSYSTVTLSHKPIECFWSDKKKLGQMISLNYSCRRILSLSVQ